MSRSYKKHPFCHMVKKDSEYKKIFNRKLRRTNMLDEVDNRPARYKKLNCSWLISDFPTKGNFKEFCELYDEDEIEEAKRDFDKYYRRK